MFSKNPKVEKEILSDFKAFIDWGIANNQTLDSIMAALSHDFSGLIRSEKYFVPRTRGYKKLQERLKEF